MSFDYIKTASSADALIKKFGKATQLKRTTVGAYDPATGTAAVTTTAQNCTAVVIDFPQSYIDNTLILAGDRRALISTVGITEPKQGDLLTWDGVDMTVINAKKLAPAGMAVLYTLQIRRP